MEGVLLLLFLSFVSFIAFIWNFIKWRKGGENRNASKGYMSGFLFISIVLFSIGYYLLSEFASGMAL